jgi:hypothetical protein
MRTPLLETIFTEIEFELGRAKRKHPDFPTLHHAMSVIREEYLELEKISFTNGVSRDSILRNQLRIETIHLAATCVRLLMDNPEST